MSDQLEQACLEVVEHGRRMLADGLVKGTSGNISVRVGDEVVITPGSVPYEEITPQGLAIVDLDGNHLGGGRPSSETPLHTLVYRETDAAAVVHTHSIYATTLACTVDELPAVHYMIHAFGGDAIEVSDYERFGSEELAAAVHAALGERRGVLLRNHGAVVHGPTLRRAYDLAVLLEWLAELYWRASVLGEPRILSHEQLEEVATEAARRSYAGAAARKAGEDAGEESAS
ncbi:MAG TPA: class II aldolase/adducin family protein [Solirubrobacterales bacterium]|nr:class II aldolase/adducin family protein [Solirubrobacterales bacterium]